MKKIRFSLLFLCVLTLTSCSSSPITIPYSDEQNVQQNSMNEIISVCDTDDKVIDKIEHFGSIAQTEDGFIYSKLSENSKETLLEMEYYQYDFSENQSIKLGSINEWVYEASYDTIYDSNHIYMLVTTGNSYNFDKTTNYLYDIDLKQNIMSATVLENGNSPYNSMTLIGNKVLIVTPGKEKCYINEYDIKSKSLSTIKEYSFNSETNTGDTIRHISSDKQYVYLLRLKMETETNVQIYVDVYDWNMELITSIDVTAAISENVLETEDINNELRQLVSHFDVNNGYVYYENFSVTRALFEIQPVNTDSRDNQVITKQVVNASPQFSKAANPTNDNTLVSFYEAYDNNIFILDTHNRQIEQYEFFAKNPDYYITYMTQNSKEDVLIFVNYKDHKTAETLSPKVYFLNISDLEKQE